MQLTNSYSIGNVSGTGSNIGSAIGDSGLGVNPENTYYNKDNAEPRVTDKGEGRTTAEMKQKATYEGWDFDTIWEIDEDIGYPTLR